MTMNGFRPTGGVRNAEDSPIKKANIKISRSDAVLLGIAGISVLALYAFTLPALTGSRTATAKIEEPAKKAENLLDQPSDSAVTDRRAALAAPKPVAVLDTVTLSRLRKVYDQIGYDLNDVRDGGKAPRLVLTALPGDLNRVEQPRERKNLFIKSTLPLILVVNERIMLDRARILQLRKKLEAGKKLTEFESGWLRRVQEDYGVLKETDDADAAPDFDTLLLRADIVPPSLALAQSAEESGWGTSRFAREGNALFGQRTWRGRNGIIPKRRAEGKKYRVRAFSSLIDGVRAYVRNLNSHPAYREFRELRAKARAAGTAPDPMRLVGALKKYSERGEDYIKTIRTILRTNKLHRFDKTRLGDPISLPNPSSGA